MPIYFHSHGCEVHDPCQNTVIYAQGVNEWQFDSVGNSKESHQNVSRDKMLWKELQLKQMSQK